MKLIGLLSLLFVICIGATSPSHGTEPVMKCPPPPVCADKCLYFCQVIPTGTPPNYPLPPAPSGEQYMNHYFNLVAEQNFDRWGSFKGFEHGVYKNGKRVYDVAVTNFGITPSADGKQWNVKFTMRDRNGDRIDDNHYVVTAILHFMDVK